MASIEVRQGRSGPSFRVSWRLEDGRDTAWEEGFRHLKAFVAKSGHARPPSSAILDGYRLGQWVSVRRSRKDSMSPEQLERLEALPGWVWDVREAAWDEGFQHLENFVAKNGHARPTQSAVVDGFRLGQWVTGQRQRQQSMNSDQRERLEALPGWVWSTFAAAWEEGFSQLVAFVQEHGHARPNDRAEIGGFFVGRWVSKQRSRRNHLDSVRCERLEQLPDWTWQAR